MARAIELVDAHIARAQEERDPALRRRLLIEGYVALLTLPTDRDLREVSARLRRLGEGLDLGHADERLLRRALSEALALAEASPDDSRIEPLVRAAGGDADAVREALRDQEFWRLADSDARDALVGFLEADDDGSRRGSVLALCRKGKVDLAGYLAERLTVRSGHVESDSHTLLQVMVEAGRESQLEAHALAILRSDTLEKSTGLEHIARLVVVKSHAGEAGEVRRLVRTMLDEPVIRAALDSAFGRSPVTMIAPTESYGRCESKLWNNWPDWRSRSVGAQSSSVGGEPDEYPEAPVIIALANAVAGTAITRESVELIDRLAQLVDRQIAANSVDPLNLALLMRERPPDMDNLAWGYLVADLRDRHERYEAARKSLAVARFAAGGELHDDTIRVLDEKSVRHFFWYYPHNQLAHRLLSLSTADWDRLRVASRERALEIRFAALVHEGRGIEARTLRAEHPGSVLERRDDGLLRMVGPLQNAGLQTQAIAMLDAYLEADPEPNTIAIYLLLQQRRVDRAKAMLRDLFSSGRQVFVAVMLLRELGEPLDVATLATPGREPLHKLENWLEAMDALAWHAAPEDIAALARNAPAAFSSLSEPEAACLRDSVSGLRAIALARRGELEASFELVAGRNLERRGYCIVRGDEQKFRYDDAPSFDLLHLVQEWVKRGHAVP